MIPLENNPATLPPNNEPLNSQIEPRYMTCLAVRAFDPTDVANEWETSCAPIAQAIKNARTDEKMNNMKNII